MPELPEVETTCNGIRSYLTNTIINKLIVRNYKLRWPIDHALPQIIKNKKIISVSRRAKYILIVIEDTGTMILHLGMSGRLSIVSKTEPPQKHDHLDLLLNNNKCLRYHDPRRFGCVLFTTEDPLEHKLLKHLGPEPLTASFTGKYLYQKSKTKKIMIKKFIMDNTIVVGVGNIYVSEALFYSGIKPQTLCNSISLEKYTLLAKQIKIILKKAIKQGGTTLKDFLAADGRPGYFAQQLAVYAREHQPCVSCGSAIAKVIIAGRASYYCNNCQI